MKMKFKNILSVLVLWTLLSGCVSLASNIGQNNESKSIWVSKSTFALFFGWTDIYYCDASDATKPQCHEAKEVTPKVPIISESLHDKLK